MKFTPAHVFEQTNDGLDIILTYYPQAEPATRNKKHKFSIRDEKTPSCVLYQGDGRYFVHDFGSGDHLDAIDVVMLETKLEFSDAMKLIAERFKIVGEEGKTRKAQAVYERAEPTEEDKEGAVDWEVGVMSATELKTIFAEQVWRYLSRKANTKAPKEAVEGSDELAVYNATEVTDRYYMKCVKWYSIVSRDKNDKTKLVKHIFRSTPEYPIFLFDEGQWQKFYKPKEREKAHRFFSTGKKPEVYLHGSQQCFNAKEDLQKGSAKSEDDEETTTKKVEQKLPEIILCSGGSDALNVAALGYQVVWNNSETAKLQSGQYYRLRGMAERVYYLGDIDQTGVRVAMELAEIYLDLHLVFLPKSLLKRRDMRGNPCKDVRDYFRYHTAKEFDNLLKMSYPLKFWDEEPKRNRQGEIIKKYGRVLYEYKPNNELIYNFLALKGFGLLEMPSQKKGEAMVQVERNVVREVQFRHVNGYVKEYLRQANVINHLGGGSHLDLVNAFHRSPNFSETSLQNIQRIQLEFNDFDRYTQYLFFQNQTWKVEDKGVTAIKPEDCEVYVWEKEVIQHEVKLLPDFFEIKRLPSGELDIQINNKDCLYFRFLINASRVYWRNELEEKLDRFTPEERAKYLHDHQFSIDGPLLDATQAQEQKQHLINKITAIGYLLHRYKDPANAFCVWGVDYNIENSEESNGGTGKSMAFMALFNLLQYEAFEGRNPKLTANPHIFESVTEHTDLLLVDDAFKYFDFDFFYSIITSFLRVNPKGTQGYTIPFEKSPKLCITSNFPPSRNDKATRRRLWFTAFSDYYHKNPNGEYREERLPILEFGKTLFTEFDEVEWNLFFNFCAQCLKAWMTWHQVEPPMDTLMQNQYKNEMGPTFHSWADAYFSVENKRLDCYIVRTMAYESFTRDYQKNLSPQGFMEKLRAWCRFYGYALNPPAALPVGKKRLTKMLPKMEWQRGQWTDTGKKESQECIYIQTNFIDPIVPEVSSADLPF